MRRDTGFPLSDAENDFLRSRRRHVLARLAAWLRHEPDDVNVILPYDEVISALGYAGEHAVGLTTIPLASIVGTVDRAQDFDRGFRPTSVRVRARWQRIAAALRRGESLPPIEVYRVGELHFVRDGHHRVSVALALGASHIDAHVTEITTRISAAGICRRRDLIVKDHRRLFAERVPLPPHRRATITITDAWDYGRLGEAVEAWGYRLMQEEKRFLDRAEIANRWYTEEFTPVVHMAEQAELVGSGTPAEAYMRIACQRYKLVRSHDWSDEIIERLRHQRR